MLSRRVAVVEIRVYQLKEVNHLQTFRPQTVLFANVEQTNFG